MYSNIISLQQHIIIVFTVLFNVIPFDGFDKIIIYYNSLTLFHPCMTWTHVLPYEFIGCIHNQSSILIICIKVQIAYQASCIWPQLNSFFQMSVFLCTLLLFFQLHAKAEKPLCRMMGDPKYPLLSKDGDVTIGALFPVHSIETLPSFKFTQKPQLSSCSRFVTCYRRYLFIYLFI